MILGRCTCGVSTFFGLKFGLTLLPLTLHAILMQTNVFWTSILSTIFLKDKIKRFEYVAIPVAFLGIIAMVLNKESGSSNLPVDTTAYVGGIVLVFLATWGLATSFIFNRKLTAVHWSTIMFVYSIFGMVIGALYISCESIVAGIFTLKTASLYGLLAVTAILDFF
jgi:drug/metabolite transporter (DMT)-like permease